MNASPAITELSIGPIELNVKNLERLTNFYHHSLGLDILTKTSQQVVLGHQTHPLVVLTNQPDLNPPQNDQAGLFHLALLFFSQQHLAQTLHKMLTTVPQHFTGSADHLVSEAFYFQDPEDNGIEIYYDREPSSWKWQNNRVIMDTIYLDPNQYIQQYINLESTDAPIHLGHIHLKVGDLDLAKSFYVDTLGFNITAEMPGALFISIAGYHHHLGMNIWNSWGAGPRSTTLGLNKFNLTLSKQSEFDLLKKRIEKQKIKFNKQNNQIIVNDPWKNQITINLKET